MNRDNLIQYAPALTAFGCKLHYHSDTGSLEIEDSPSRKGAAQILDKALADIRLYADTANYADGVCTWVLADIIDGEPNPLAPKSRENSLQVMGIKQNGKFIVQELNAAKVNRSWHGSDIPNDCSHFGEICTHRGIIDVAGKRGRKSTRLPEEYHKETKRGISREQLITPNVEKLYATIPSDVLVSIKTGTHFDIKNLNNLIGALSRSELLILKEKIDALQTVD